MALETSTYINGLVATNPVDSTDQVASLGGHVRLLKNAIKATFPNVSGVVNPTQQEFNYLVGVTSSIQTQLTAKAAKGVNADITQLTGLTTPLTVEQGGTGAATEAAVRASLNLEIGVDVMDHVAPGTSGNVLTSNGTAWTSAAIDVEPGGLGVEQTWQDVTASRVWSTTYQNLTGKPIQVAIKVSDGSELFVGPTASPTLPIGNAPSGFTLYAVIPDQWYYKLDHDSSVYWYELR